MISERNSDGLVFVVITGSEEEVEASIQDYYRSFNPLGYDTKVTQPPKDMGGDIWEARMTRYASCD